MNWTEWLNINIKDGVHKDHPHWRPVEVWFMMRSDGLLTAHKMESPVCFWRETVEQSMELADEHIPLGADLPEGMRTREDPYYGPLWEIKEERVDI